MGVFLCFLSNQNTSPVTLGFLEVDVSELSRLEMPIQAAVRNMRYRGLDQVRVLRLAGVGKVGWSGEVDWLVRVSSCVLFGRLKLSWWFVFEFNQARKEFLECWKFSLTQSVAGNVCRKVALPLKFPSTNPLHSLGNWGNPPQTKSDHMYQIHPFWWLHLMSYHYIWLEQFSFSDNVLSQVYGKTDLSQPGWQLRCALRAHGTSSGVV